MILSKGQFPIAVSFRFSIMYIHTLVQRGIRCMAPVSKLVPNSSAVVVRRLDWCKKEKDTGLVGCRQTLAACMLSACYCYLASRWPHGDSRAERRASEPGPFTYPPCLLEYWPVSSFHHYRRFVKAWCVVSHQSVSSIDSVIFWCEWHTLLARGLCEPYLVPLVSS